MVEVIKPKDKLVTVDIKSSFHHVPIGLESQRYLGVRWQGSTYCWAVLPFELCVSPFFFGKTLCSVASYLRQLGIRIVLYVDNFLLCATPGDIDQHSAVSSRTLSRLGLQVKSSLEPAYAN